MIVYTSRVTYAGADRFDVTRKTGAKAGHPFAPSWAILRPALEARRAGRETEATWETYSAAYSEEMRRSYRAHRRAWDDLLARPEVTLVCYCTDPARCHRTLLAAILVKLGATYKGERGERWRDEG